VSVKRTGGVVIDGASTFGSSNGSNVRPDVTGFDVPFDRDVFTQMIGGSHSYEVTWEKGQYCPFLKGPSPKDHDINCKVCRSGFIYYDPINTQMIVTSVGISQQYFAYGRFDSGRAQITAYPQFKLSFWDRVTLRDSRSRHSELVLRQRASIKDRLKFDPICIERIVWAADDETLAIATESDYTIDEETRELVWLTTNRPPADTFYSALYFFRPAYIVMDLVHNVRDQKLPQFAGEKTTQMAEFPVQVIGQLEFFVRNEGLEAPNEGHVNNPFPVQRQTY
jgi:hypothetical protein